MTYLDTLYELSIQAPSAVNQQSWLFCVVRDRAVLDHISNEAKAHMLKTSQAALSCVSWDWRQSKLLSQGAQLRRLDLSQCCNASRMVGKRR
ncbi:MAG: nitroreductase family protein [Pseudolabrys sp.]